jgi:Raf kinase inhibitor-like YbhB/YbcL family protein
MKLISPRFLTATFSAALAILVGCSSSAVPEIAVDQPQQKGSAMITITSSAFQQGAVIPKEHTGEGTDVSPPLAWSGIPAGTKSLALICDDPDAPSAKRPGPEPWVHWVIYNIPADATGLPAGIPRDADVKDPAGAQQGHNSWPADNIGYLGPMPPPGSGPHRYYFKLYALDTQLPVTSVQTDKNSLLAAMQGHILAEGKLMGMYERK